MPKRGPFKKLAPVTPPLLKLDLGAGLNPREGFESVDRLPFGGTTQHVVDLRQPWPWPDHSVAETHCSHFLEHLTALERVHFVNELHRVLVLGGTCQLIVPHWASCRAYGDPTHQWPPVSEFWFYYLSREWRMGDPAKNLGPNAPHTDITHNPEGFRCHFVATWGYTLRPDLGVRNLEWQQFALANYKEVVLDIVATLIKA